MQDKYKKWLNAAVLLILAAWLAKPYLIKDKPEAGKPKAAVSKVDNSRLLGSIRFTAEHLDGEPRVVSDRRQPGRGGDGARLRRPGAALRRRAGVDLRRYLVQCRCRQLSQRWQSGVAVRDFHASLRRLAGCHGRAPGARLPRAQSRFHARSRTGQHGGTGVACESRHE